MRYGLVKSALDAHTLGMNSLASLLEECRFEVFISDASVSEAVDKISDARHFKILKTWIIENKISHIGYSYRLDPKQGLISFGKLVSRIEEDDQLSPKRGGCVQEISFAGLPEACQLVVREFGGRFKTFKGDDTPASTLQKLGIPDNLIPRSIRESSLYDELRLSFGKEIIHQEKQTLIQPFEDYRYESYGTPKDHLITRLAYAQKTGRLPLTRAHVGPYLQDREEALALFSDWLKRLSRSKFLDILSVGSSQLSQSMFGEKWGDLPNGGGVPFNSAFELRAIREDAAPMLVRAYSATNNIPDVAKVLEENLNMAWHALSLWWFNQMDGRGPLSLKESLSQHIEALRYIARKGKPYESNTPHHFAFRGADDVTYVVSSYLAAKTAKLLGINTFVLQNMLNTPKSTWGVNDLAKSRVLLKLIRSLEDRRFRVIYQPRAGLDYFSPDSEKAKTELAAVTALMDDVEPDKRDSPEIVHVVSYSEALFLADPDVINESVQITKAALKHYPEFRKKNSVEDIILSKELEERVDELWEESRGFLEDIERNIEDLFTSEGLFRVFELGYFPVPYLWECREEFSRAVDWTTKLIDGRVHVVDDKGRKMSLKDRLARIKALNA